jgi:hypothetical protein
MNYNSATDSQNISERQFALVLSARLEDAGWHIQLEPRIDAWRPDLIAEGPSGVTFVVECKFTREDVDFSTIDYVLSASEALRSEDPSSVVRPVLVTAAPARGIVAEVASDSDLKVFQLSQGPDAVARSLVDIDNNSTDTLNRRSYEAGALSAKKLQEEIDRVLREIRTTSRLDAEIAAAGLNREELARIEESPVLVSSTAAGIDPSVITISIVFISALSPRILENLWGKILLPRIKQRFGNDAIGAEKRVGA